jgi:hypothetical protein
MRIMFPPVPAASQRLETGDDDPFVHQYCMTHTKRLNCGE